MGVREGANNQLDELYELFYYLCKVYKNTRPCVSKNQEYLIWIQIWCAIATAYSEATLLFTTL